MKAQRLEETYLWMKGCLGRLDPLKGSGVCGDDQGNPMILCDRVKYRRELREAPVAVDVLLAMCAHQKILAAFQ